jgi:TolB-like protein
MQLPSVPSHRLAPLFFFLAAFFLLALLFSPPRALAFFWPFSTEAKTENDKAPEPLPVVPQQLEPPLSEEQALYRGIRDLADDLFLSLADPDPENGDLAQGVVVTTFVDLKKLYRTSSLGRYVAEQLLTEMGRRRYDVIELRKSRAIMVREPGGEYGLSRDPAEIGQSVSAGAMLTGTYTVAGDGIIINARIIDNRSARLLASASAILPRNQLTGQLLADSASVRMKIAEPMYMKKLEM